MELRVRELDRRLARPEDELPPFRSTASTARSSPAGVLGETPATITFPTATPSSEGGAASKRSVPSPGSGASEPRSVDASSTVDGNGSAASPSQASAQVRNALPVGKTSLHFFAFTTVHALPPFFRQRANPDRPHVVVPRMRATSFRHAFGNPVLPSCSTKPRTTGFQHLAYALADAAAPQGHAASTAARTSERTPAGHLEAWPQVSFGPAARAVPVREVVRRRIERVRNVGMRVSSSAGSG